MIRPDDLIAVFREMLVEHWSYEYGAARRGCVDCSGAFVYAFRRLGATPPQHSSNAIARLNVGAFQNEPAPGYAAFKWRPDSAGKTPARWQDGKGDFYHIGLVDDTGRMVLNAKGTKSGFSSDPVSAWHSFAPLLAVDYEGLVGDKVPDPGQSPGLPSGHAAGASKGGDGVIYSAIVSTESGNLNVRSGPGTKYPKTGSLPRGETVDVLMEYDLDGDGKPEWAYVGGDGKQGYVSAQYLARIDDAPAIQAPDAPEPAPDEIVMRYGVWVPCENMDQAVALAAAHPGAIFTAYKPPDEKGE